MLLFYILSGDTSGEDLFSVTTNTSHIKEGNKHKK